MLDKVAHILTNKKQEDFGITEEQIEQSLAENEIPEELR
jgi:hypothetical protein